MPVPRPEFESPNWNDVGGHDFLKGGLGDYDMVTPTEPHGTGGLRNAAFSNQGWDHGLFAGYE